MHYGSVPFLKRYPGFESTQLFKDLGRNERARTKWPLQSILSVRHGDQVRSAIVCLER